jgi:hypothetical protein
VCFEEKYSEVNCVQVTECVSVRLDVLFVRHVAQAQCGAASAYETGAAGTAAATDLSQKYVDKT